MTNRHKKARDRPGFSFKMKHSQKVIDFAVFLASQDAPAFSSRDISRRIFEKFSLHVSHVTVIEWIAQAPTQLDSVFDVPCFSCFWRDSLKARRCHPENCEELTEWLESLEMLT